MCCSIRLYTDPAFSFNYMLETRSSLTQKRFHGILRTIMNAEVLSILYSLFIECDKVELHADFLETFPNQNSRWLSTHWINLLVACQIQLSI